MPLVIVHSKTLAPNPKAVMPELGNNEFVITAGPESTDQVPTPDVGELAAKV